MSGESTAHKAAVARSRSLIMARLDTPRPPYDCKRCEYETRCASLAPGREVVCGLTDEACGITLPEPKEGDWETCTEDNAEYYLQVRVVGL